jgi:hypothetical protein
MTKTVTLGCAALVGRRPEHNDHFGIGYLEAAFHRGLGVTRRRCSPIVAAAASMLLFLFASASPGCSLKSPVPSQDAAAHQDAAVPQDAAVHPDTAVHLDGPPIIYLPPPCSAEIKQQAIDRVVAAAPCFSGWLTGNGASFNLNAGGNGAWILRPCDDGTAARFSQLEDAARSALQGLDTTGCELMTDVVNQDYRKLVNAIASATGLASPGHAVILNENGAVVDVRAGTDPATDAEVLNAILAAVGGLTFPCLANVQICTEPLLPNF